MFFYMQDALRTFLLRKLDNLTRDDMCQITMISTWITELYLDKVNTFETSIKSSYDTCKCYSVEIMEKVAAVVILLILCFYVYAFNEVGLTSGLFFLSFYCLHKQR